MPSGRPGGHPAAAVAPTGRGAAMIVICAQAFPPASGGIESLMAGLAEQAAAAGHAVRVLADRKPGWPEHDRQVAERYAVDRFGGLRPIRRRIKARRLAALLRAGPIDAIFADSWKSLEALPKGRLPTRVTVFAHGNEFPPDRRKEARIRRALNRADAVIAVSRDTVERLSPALPEGLPVNVIHPPVAPLPVPSDADRRFAEALWGGSGPRLLCLCRLVPLKGVDQAIRAVGRLPEGRLVIAGSGPDQARLEALVAESGLGGRVRFAGRVEGGRKTALLESAEIFMQPGRQIGAAREGFGITYLEAALAGLPTISGNKGGAPEAVVDGETGFVVDGEKLDEIVAAVRRLIDDPALRGRFAAAGRRLGKAALWPDRIGRILAVGGLHG